MNEDIIEKPVCRILYRQSSLETRLSPINLAEEYDSEDDIRENRNPKIIKVVPKLPQKNINNEIDSGNGSNAEKIEADLENIFIDSVVKGSIKDVAKVYKSKTPPREKQEVVPKNKVMSSIATDRYELWDNQNPKQVFKNMVKDREAIFDTPNLLQTDSLEVETVSEPSVGILRGKFYCFCNSIVLLI